jgi:hypothetical protein
MELIMMIITKIIKLTKVNPKKYMYILQKLKKNLLYRMCNLYIEKQILAHLTYVDLLEEAYC